MPNITKENLFTGSTSVTLFAIFCTLLWGSAFPCIKTGYVLFSIGDSVFNKILFAGYRFTGAGLMVLIFLCLSQKKLVFPRSKALFDIVVLGLVQTTIQYIFFYVGLSHTTGVKGSILGAMGTFIAVILAHFFYKNDKLNRNKTIGCIIGFSGVVLINLGPAGMDAGFTLYGEGFMVLAAAASSFGFLLSKRATNSDSPAVVTAYQLFIGGIFLVVIGLAGGGTLQTVSTQGVLLLTYMSFLSAAAFVIWAALLKYNRVGKISIFNFLTPIFGVFLSALILGEHIWELKNLIALLLVCAGIFVVNRHPKLGKAILDKN